ncbi:MAG: peptide chain release factor N(5)-glutamine methyltransferase [Candidatus Paceibacterota bacterium]
MLSQEEEWLLKEGFQGEKSEAFFASVQKLKSGTPLAYLIGYTPFLNCQIFLDSKPLIPRPETEFWAEKVIIEINDLSKTTNRTIDVLDLCAGSGCIGVAVAKNCPSVKAHFSELEEAHLKTIEKNCRENNIQKNRYKIHQSDLFTKLPKIKYDLILSNPPYIDKKLNRAEKSVVENEPELALFGGKDGMEVIGKIITRAPDYLKQNGELWLEHEPEQTEDIKVLASKNNFKFHNHKDQYGVERFSQLVVQ